MAMLPSKAMRFEAVGCGLLWLEHVASNLVTDLYSELKTIESYFSSVVTVRHTITHHHSHISIQY